MSLTQEICHWLLKTHRSVGWLAEKEARFSPRRIDVLAISPGAAEVIGFEIKVSVSDFRNELRDPEKRLAVMRHCTQFYFVVPRGLISRAEVPSGCGLIYFCDGYFVIAKAAPGKTITLPIEDTRDSAEGEWEAISKLEDWCWATDIVDEYHYMPRWALPFTPRPLRFDFDVADVAAQMASVPMPSMQWQEVPF